MLTRVEVIHQVLSKTMGYQDSPTMQAEMWGPAEEIATALRVNELELKVVVRHMSDMGAVRSVCGDVLDAGGNSIVVRKIDDVDCVKCLRMLAKDAGRYGNGRRPSRKW